MLCKPRTCMTSANLFRIATLKNIPFFLVLRKYATYLFTTPLSNIVYGNMMSRLNLKKQFFDNQCTHFKIKSFVYNASL